MERNMNIVTTSQKSSAIIHAQAQEAAERLQLTYVSRKKLSLRQLQDRYGSEYIVVYNSQGPSLYIGEGKEHHFHLSMAQLRILHLQRTGHDYLVEAIGLPRLSSFLDCTLGLGSDSIVVSYAYMTGQNDIGAVPQKTHMVGIEAFLPLHHITQYGLSHFCHDDPHVTQALRQIKTYGCNYQDYLATCETNAFDVVYLDPMFEVPIVESPQFLSLRDHLVKSACTDLIIREAMRVAKRKVIIKERPFSRIFQMIEPDYFVGGKYSKIVYAVYEV